MNKQEFLTELKKHLGGLPQKDIDEHMDPQLPPEVEVARVSRLKALAVPRKQEDLVIAADTIVVCDGQVLGKPADQQDAYRMLRLLSGNRSYHETHNAFFDALEELKIMELLGHPRCDYIPL